MHLTISSGGSPDGTGQCQCYPASKIRVHLRPSVVRSQFRVFRTAIPHSLRSLRKFLVRGTVHPRSSIFHPLRLRLCRAVSFAVKIFIAFHSSSFFKNCYHELSIHLW